MLPRQRNRNALVTSEPTPIYEAMRRLESAYTRALETIGQQEQEIRALKRKLRQREANNG